MLELAKLHRNAHRWALPYALHALRNLLATPVVGPRHILFATCDHFEPLWGAASEASGRDRVARWEEGYTAFARDFRDADGRPPRHTFFFPGEQYHPTYLEALGRLAAAGFGEVELHLHHDADDAAKLTRSLLAHVDAFGSHGHLSQDATGRRRYTFIHGNWCLANSRKDGKHCGVDSELRVLGDTGCYADFTFPSAPDETQHRIVNQIYWPTGDPDRARSHERGVRARVNEAAPGPILMIQGPLALGRRHGRRGVRIESAALTANDPGTPSRIGSWVSQAIHVAGMPEWVFVKVHTHGAPEAQSASLLGAAGRAMHRALADHYNDGRRFVLHYVTAREMFNIARAAIDGRRGDPNDFRNHVLPPPQVAS